VGAAPQAQIWVMFADGTGAQPLTNGSQNDIYPSWSPDGTKILFGRGGPVNSSGPYTLSADGSGAATQIVSGAWGHKSSWERVAPYIDGPIPRIDKRIPTKRKLSREKPQQRQR
jgi:Tol biopolymer transport system component